jgi:hypothetical protein
MYEDTFYVEQVAARQNTNKMVDAVDESRHR